MAQLRSRSVLFLLVLCVVCVALSGCGRKTPPRPMKEAVPAATVEVAAEVTADGVEMSWAVPEAILGPEAATHRYSIRRVEIPWGDRNCSVCPSPVEREIQGIEPSSPSPAVVQGDRLFWVDRNVASKTAFRYQVVLQDKNERPIVTSQSFTVRVVTAPGAPSGLSAASQAQGLFLRWEPSKRDPSLRGQGELLYRVERKAVSGPWVKASEVDIAGTRFLDTGAAGGQSYEYRVTPLLSFEGTIVRGTPAVTTAARTPDAGLAPPPARVWVIPGKGVLEVQWTPSEGKVEGYHVYRRVGKEITRLTATPVAGPPFIDRTFKKNTVYEYAVSTVSPAPPHREGLVSKWVEVRSVLTD